MKKKAGKKKAGAKPRAAHRRARKKATAPRRGKRASAKHPPPPFPLPAAALAEWDRLLTLGVEVAPINRTRLGMYCAAVGRATEAGRALADIAANGDLSRGFLLKQPTGWVENPLVRVVRDEEAHIARLAADLGIAGLAPPASDAKTDLPSF